MSSATVDARPPGTERREGQRLRPRLRRPEHRDLAVVVVFVVLVVAWQISAQFFPSYIIPDVRRIWARALEILSSGSTLDAIWATSQRILGGFAISAVIGILTGIVMAMHAGVRNYLAPVTRLVLGVPALTWVLLAILWFTSTEARVWFVMVILVYPIVTVNTYDGIRSVPKDLHDMAKSFRASPVLLYRRVMVPGALPSIFSGLRLSLSFAARIAVFAEALSTASGIGMQMYRGSQTFDTAAIIVWTVILVGLFYALGALLELIEKRFFRWRETVTA